MLKVDMERVIDMEKETKEPSVYLMREEGRKFVEEMESVLKENDYKGGWKNSNDSFLEKN